MHEDSRAYSERKSLGVFEEESYNYAEYHGRIQDYVKNRVAKFTEWHSRLSHHSMFFYSAPCIKSFPMLASAIAFIIYLRLEML